jgi:hypothetical protein
LRGTITSNTKALHKGVPFEWIEGGRVGRWGSDHLDLLGTKFRFESQSDFQDAVVEFGFDMIAIDAVGELERPFEGSILDFRISISLGLVGGSRLLAGQAENLLLHLDFHRFLGDSCKFSAQDETPFDLGDVHGRPESWSAGRGRSFEIAQEVFEE